MAERKLVIYSLNPEDPSDRKKLGSFELDDDGKVQADFNNEGLKYELMQGLFDAKGHKLVTMESDGERFMELLAGKFGPSSFVAVETD
jgi:hypothetical protein